MYIHRKVTDKSEQNKIKTKVFYINFMFRKCILHAEPQMAQRKYQLI